MSLLLVGANALLRASAACLMLGASKRTTVIKSNTGH